MKDGRRAAEEKELAGLTVAVTRPSTKGDTLTAQLTALGARVLDAPALRIVPPADPGPLRRAAARLDEFDWVMVTSVTGVEALAAAGREGGRSPRRLAVVGSQSAAAAVAAGWSVDLVPRRYDAEGLLEQLDREGVALAGARVLLPLAEGARDVLREGWSVLVRGGYIVAAGPNVPPAR